MTPALEEGFSISTVAVRETRTLYSYIGNLGVYLLLLGLALLALQRVVALIRKRRNKETDAA